MQQKGGLIVNFSILILFFMVIFGYGIFLLHSNIKYSRAADEDDVVPPVVSDVRIMETTATNTIISWTTNENADSLINYGLNKSYGVARDPYFDKTEHSIVLNDLLPDTLYYFRVTSTDDSGNQGISNNFTFITLPKINDHYGNVDEGYGDTCIKEPGKGQDGQKGVDSEGTSTNKLNIDSDVDVDAEDPKIPELESDRLAEVLEMIEEVKSEKVLEIIKEHIEIVAQDVSTPLSIILDNADVEVGTDYAVIYWQTSKEADSMVSLVNDRYYDFELENPYEWNEGDPEENVMDHIIEINGLKPATTYHYQVKSKTSLGQEASSQDSIFTTKSILPVISSLAVSKVQEDSATITWLTNIPTSAIAEYTNLNTGESKLEGHSAFVTSHSIHLRNLVFDTYYSVVITVQNEQNEKVVSDPLTFITVRDEVPPTIAKVNTEATLYPGTDNKVQTIVSWETDEPSSCQLFYHRGIVALDEVNTLPKEEDYTTKHVNVVTNFLPATVYKFWVECEDDAKNKAKSEDYTMLTPSREQSIIDIILKNFESTFGWVKNM